MTITVLDFETTGFNRSADDIIEIGAVKIDLSNGCIVDELSTLIKPKGLIPCAITALTGIDDNMVKTAPKFEDVADRLMDLIGDDIIMGHNVTFDLAFLYRALEKLGRTLKVSYVDTYTLSRKYFQGLENYKLTTVCDALNIYQDNAHRALDDCYSCYNVFCKLPAHAQIMAKPYNPPLKKTTKTQFSDSTQSLQALEQIIAEIIDDDVVTEEEFWRLTSWVEVNRYLSGEYPYDRIVLEIDEILADGIIEPCELEEMYHTLKDLIKPKYDSKAASEKIELTGKKICLTGDFDYGSRSEVSDYLTSKGAIMTTAVSGKTDYLIVGELGSFKWTNGNYGGKIKKAFELKDQGKPIQIIGEKDFFKSL